MGGKDSKETRANFGNVNDFSLFFATIFSSVSLFFVFVDKERQRVIDLSEIAMSPVPALPM